MTGGIKSLKNVSKEELTDWVKLTPEELADWRQKLAALHADPKAEIINWCEVGITIFHIIQEDKQEMEFKNTVHVFHPWKGWTSIATDEIGGEMQCFPPNPNGV